MATSTMYLQKEEKMSKPDDVQEVLQWLLDPIGERGSGRTIELIHAYILLAIRYNNVRIVPRDHYPGPQLHHRNFMDNLMHVAEQQYPALEFVRHSHDAFACYGLKLPDLNIHQEP